MCARGGVGKRVVGEPVDERAQAWLPGAGIRADVVHVTAAGPVVPGEDLRRRRADAAEDDVRARRQPRHLDGLRLLGDEDEAVGLADARVVPWPVRTGDEEDAVVVPLGLAELLGRGVPQALHPQSPGQPPVNRRVDLRQPLRRQGSVDGDDSDHARSLPAGGGRRNADLQLAGEDCCHRARHFGVRGGERCCLNLVGIVLELTATRIDLRKFLLRSRNRDDI